MHDRKFREERNILNARIACGIQSDCKVTELCTLVYDEKDLALRATLQALPNPCDRHSDGIVAKRSGLWSGAAGDVTIDCHAVIRRCVHHGNNQQDQDATEHGL